MPSIPPESEPRLLRIHAREGLLWPDLRELADYRELLFVLSWKELAVRYKQTALGIAWAVLQPTLTMVLFSVVFGRLAGIPSDGKPYPVFVFCALVPWQLFVFALSQSANSLIGNERLVTKVYFPRIVLPISSVLTGLVDFLVAFVVLLAMMTYYGLRPGIGVIFLPVFVGLALLAALAAGIGLSAFNAEFRDVRHALPFLAQIWMFATPIAYPASMFPEGWRLLLGLNPMAGVIEGFRWALLGTAPPGAIVWVSGAITAAAFILCVTYFMRVERRLADVI